MARYVHEVHMRWGDMDAYRHINNGAYLAYLEQARIGMFFQHIDGFFSAGTVVSRHVIEYVRPIVYHPEPLRIEVWVEKIGGARFTVRYEIFDGDLLAAKAETTCVTFDFETDRPRRIAPPEREILLSYADEQPA
jgi:acyl-CoA thioester hydrolase